jgi:putative oxidoreductase
MEMLHRVFGKREDWSSLALRVPLGIIFMAHGYQKLFGGKFEAIVGFFDKVGIPAPEFFTGVVGVTEFFGGLLVLIGLLTRYAGSFLAVVMIVAIVKVKASRGLVGGYELDLALLGMCAALIIAGGRNFSLEKNILKRDF